MGSKPCSGSACQSQQTSKAIIDRLSCWHPKGAILVGMQQPCMRRQVLLPTVSLYGIKRCRRKLSKIRMNMSSESTNSSKPYFRALVLSNMMSQVGANA